MEEGGRAKASCEGSRLCKARLQVELGCQTTHQRRLPPAAANNLKGAFCSAGPIPDLICLGKFANGFFIFVSHLSQRELMSVNAFLPIMAIRGLLFRGMLPLGLAVTSELHLGVWWPSLQCHGLFLSISIDSRTYSQTGLRAVLERASKQKNKPLAGFTWCIIRLISS